jgi:hypothetical protein
MIIRVAAEPDDAHQDARQRLSRQEQHNCLLKRLDLDLQVDQKHGNDAQLGPACEGVQLGAAHSP